MNVIDLLEEIGFRPKKVASSKGGEYHSPCPAPKCGGIDRFCVWPKEGINGRYWCRQCSRSGDAIQFCCDFMGMNFTFACEKVGRKFLSPISRRPNLSKKKFIPSLLSMPSDLWQQKAFDFIQKSHQYLCAYPSLLDQSKRRGLTKKSILEFQLGWNTTTIFESRESWSLPDESSEGGSRHLCLPHGIVIPAFRNGNLIKIKIRRHNWQPEDAYPKYHLVAGGVNSPSTYGEINKPFLIIESELDAILIQEFASDLCCCLALGGAMCRPDEFIDKILQQAACILFALDFDEAGKKAYNFWKGTYRQTQPWPVPKGKSPGDAYLLGVDLRNWIECGLKAYSKF